MTLINAQASNVEENAARVRKAFASIVKVGLSRVPHHLVPAVEECLNRVTAAFVAQGDTLTAALRQSEALHAENIALLHANDLLQKKLKKIQGDIKEPLFLYVSSRIFSSH